MKKTLSSSLKKKLDELDILEREFSAIRYSRTANNVDLLGAKIYKCTQEIVKMLRENRDNL